MHETLNNPIFWQGFVAAMLLAIIVSLPLLALTGRANRDLQLRHDRRHGDTQAWPGTRSDSLVERTRSRRSEMRGGPR